MVVTQNLRSEGPVARDIRFKTKADYYRTCFKLARDDTVDVVIVDFEGGAARRTLAGGERIEADEPTCFEWDGRDDAGLPVGAGRYRLRLSLEEGARTVTSGERLRIRRGETGTPVATPPATPPEESADPGEAAP